MYRRVLSTFWPWSIGYSTYASSVSRDQQTLRATHHWMLFMTESFDVTPKTTEHKLIVRSGKSEAEVGLTYSKITSVEVLLVLKSQKHRAVSLRQQSYLYFIFDMFAAYHQTYQATISSSTVSASRRAVSQGRCPAPDWKRLPGRPRKTWIQQVEEDHRCTITPCGHRRRIARCGGRYDPRWSSAAVSEWVSEWVYICNICYSRATCTILECSSVSAPRTPMDACEKGSECEALFWPLKI